jgi:hypothetical protein
MKNNFTTSSTGVVNWKIVAPVAAMVGLLVVANMLGNLGGVHAVRSSNNNLPFEKTVEQAEATANQLGQSVVKASSVATQTANKFLDSVGKLGGPDGEAELPPVQ